MKNFYQIILSFFIETFNPPPPKFRVYKFLQGNINCNCESMDNLSLLLLSDLVKAEFGPSVPYPDL